MTQSFEKRKAVFTQAPPHTGEAVVALASLVSQFDVDVKILLVAIFTWGPVMDVKKEVQTIHDVSPHDVKKY